MAIPRGPQPLAGQERRLRLLAFVRQDSVVRVDKRIEDTAMVWPHLLVIEFIAAMIFTVGLVLLSALVNAPLLDHSNPDRTPNPSKAPWYFLFLQELLLHMHPALAGVIVPGLGLVLIAAIPYVDRSREGLGTWFTSTTGRKVAIFSAVYTLVIVGGLILFDAALKSSRTASALCFGLCPRRPDGTYDTAHGPFLPFLPQGYAAWAEENLPGGKALIPDIVIPVFVMIGFSLLLVFIVRRFFRGTTRDWIIALFTGFVATYYLMTFVGTAMRGTGMDLFLPWITPSPLE